MFPRLIVKQIECLMFPLYPPKTINQIFQVADSAKRAGSIKRNMTPSLSPALLPHPNVIVYQFAFF